MQVQHGSSQSVGPSLLRPLSATRRSMVTASERHRFNGKVEATAFFLQPLDPLLTRLMVMEADRAVVRGPFAFHPVRFLGCLAVFEASTGSAWLRPSKSTGRKIRAAPACCATPSRPGSPPRTGRPRQRSRPGYGSLGQARLRVSDFFFRGATLKTWIKVG